MPFLSIAVPGRRDRNTGCGYIAVALLPCISGALDRCGRCGR
jgi:hypothetical protein